MKNGFFAAVCLILLLWGAACTQTTPNDLEIIRDPLPPTAAEDAAQLRQINLPMRDLVQLTEQYKQVEVPAQVIHAAVNVGDVVSFWYEDQENEVEIEAEARLVAQSETLNMWVEEGVEIDQQDLETTLEILENEIFPRNRALFGQESRPGIDGDERLNILHVAEMGGGVIGYFSSADAFPSEVNPFSNGRDMFYINLEFVTIGNEDYFDVVAHEFQHMIHWHVDRSEMTWLNEGFSELAAAVNGYGDSDHLDTFLNEPDTPLTFFDYEGGDYGAAYLFSRYLYDRFGEEFITKMVAEPQDSANGLEAVLTATGRPMTFEAVFADWVVDSYAAARGLSAINGRPEVFDGVRFPGTFAIQRLRPGDVQREEVTQFGTDFWRITGGEPVTVSFLGSTQVPLMTAEPSDGAFMWSAVPGDESERDLTHHFDISGVTEATLIFDLWYDIEVGWDFGYVAVSTDKGQTWDTLQTTATTAANPRGTNLGHGFTGLSGSGQEPVWIEQTADLTPYLGGDTLWVRFAYITDDAIFQQGMSVDHIRIPELGFVDSAEEGEGQWEAQGFARHGNILPQTYIVQQILIDQDGRTAAKELPLEADQSGSWEIPLGDGWEEAIIAVSGSTHTTIHPSTYQIGIE